ncbi:hypothetical protein [Legionella clemsonensis]|uniref:Uncharacterized protein n=1 Tax=Legionella clemsonensis TaxID=1867846 RepID=A0A222P590_9GAMM|nr:hypothetical protein [Legionella clemsonensis]ASQ47008.1 hypothetical protein clem_12365 [Legionella clemsonensis]
MKISPETIKQIISGKLTALTIQGESLRAEDISLLASAIENPGCRLTELHLNYTDMTNESIKPFYEVLKKIQLFIYLILTGIKLVGNTQKR